MMNQDQIKEHIAKLKREAMGGISNLGGYLVSHPTTSPTDALWLINHIAALEAEIARLRKDAELYKWIAEDIICHDYGDNDQRKMGWYISMDYRKLGDECFMHGETLIHAIANRMKEKCAPDTSTQEAG